MCDRNIQSVKKDMMNLWKATFGDSDEYIKLVFDEYFNIDNVDYIYDNTLLVSSLFSVKYYLGYNNICYDNDNNICIDKFKNKLSSAYLCGLATLPDYRNKGLMSKLINRYNTKLLNDKVAISFLIPADSNLKYFYKKVGYVDMSYYNADIYTSIHSFDDLLDYNISEYDNCIIKISNKKHVDYIVVDVNKYFCSVLNNVSEISNSDSSLITNDSLLNAIYNYLCESAIGCSGLRIYYSYKDFINVIRENIINKGKILFIKNHDNKPLGLLVCSNIVEGAVNVQLLLSNSKEIENILLQSLKFLLKENVSLSVRSNGVGNKVYAPFVVEEGTPDGDVNMFMDISDVYKRRKSFAMAKILNVAEVLKFVAASHPSSEFSILIKQDDLVQNQGFYSVSRGNMTFTPLTRISSEALSRIEVRCREDVNCFSISVPELAAFLWRNTNPNSIQDTAIAIPRFPVNVALLLE